jgi:hypothetical protein
MTPDQHPANQEIAEVIETYATEIAEAEYEATPGNTRIALSVKKEQNGEITGQIHTDNVAANALPALSENEVYLWRRARVLDWSEELHQERWLSGQGVQEEGLEYFTHRHDGPAEARPS